MHTSQQCNGMMDSMAKNVKYTPPIVKELRAEEKQGTLKTLSTQSAEQILQPCQEPEDQMYMIHPTSDTNSHLEKFFDIEKSYETIFQNYAIAITIADDKEKIYSWNKYAEELLGMNEQDLYKRSVKSLYPPEEWKRIRAENVRRKGIKYRMETRILRKNNVTLDIELSLCILRGSGGKNVGSVGIIKDITELKKAERQLIESEARYRTIFDNSAVAITLTDGNENIISWNKYAEHLLCMTEQDLYNCPVHSLYPPDEWQKIRAQNVRQKGMQHHLETKIKTKNRGLLDVDISLSVIKDANGAITGSIGIIKDISAQKQTERRINTLMENADDTIYLIDRDFCYLLVNNAFLKRFQITKETVLGKPLDVIHSDTMTTDLKKMLTTVFDNGQPIKDEQKFEGCWYLRTFSPVKDTLTNEVTAVLVIAKDITDRKQAEEILSKSEKKYHTIFDFSPELILRIDKKGTILDANSRLYEWLGYEPEEITGNSINNLPFFNLSDQKTISTKFKQRMKGADIEPYELTFIAKEGCTHIGRIHAAPIYDDQHKITAEILMISDITDQRAMEETLRRSEERFKLLYEKAPVAFHTLTPKGTISNVNETWCHIMGYSKEDVIGKPIFSFIHKNEQKTAQKSFSTKLESQKEYPGGHERVFITKDGQERIFVTHDFFSYTKDHKVKFIHTTMEDFTEHKKVWTDLVKSEEKYRILAETSADGVFTTDTLGRLTYINPAMEKILGRRKGRILATPFRTYLGEGSVYDFQQTMIDVRKDDNKIEGVELEVVHDDGFVVPVEANISPLKKDSKFVGIECALRDISERKHVEQELIKSEKLRTEFMNIAAHELKSPVTPIKGYLELIESDKNATEQIKNWARVGLRNSDRLLRLVNDILDVSRLDSDTMRFNMERLELSQLLKDTVEDFAPSIEQLNLKFIKRFPENLPPVFGDKFRIAQVLKNLFSNALKFTDSGSISLTAEIKDKDIVISVADTGIGISPDETKKVFSKFYQAYTGEDRRNQGTGLGLFICREIIRKHNGDMWVESAPGNGSTFTFKIPIWAS
jgi:PAS domain S-box-containing protein